MVRRDRLQGGINLQQPFQNLASKNVEGFGMKVMEMKNLKRISQTCAHGRARGLRYMTMQDYRIQSFVQDLKFRVEQ